MFGIGMPELILILAVALIVIGPKKLPDLAKSLGRALGEFKKATSELKESMEIENPVSDVKRSFDNLNKDWKKGLYDKATGGSKTESEASSEAPVAAEASSEEQAAAHASSEAPTAAEASSEAPAAAQASSEAPVAAQASSEEQAAAEASPGESEGEVGASDGAVGSEDAGSGPQADEPGATRLSGRQNEEAPERQVPGPETGEPGARAAVEDEDADVSSGEKAKKTGEV